MIAYAGQAILHATVAALIVEALVISLLGGLIGFALVAVARRSVAMALAVTLACVALGFPLAYYMARYASSRMKLARAGLGTNNVDHCARLCHASTVTGLRQSLGSGAMTNSFDDLETADHVETRDEIAVDIPALLQQASQT